MNSIFSFFLAKSFFQFSSTVSTHTHTHSLTVSTHTHTHTHTHTFQVTQFQHTHFKCSFNIHISTTVSTHTHTHISSNTVSTHTFQVQFQHTHFNNSFNTHTHTHTDTQFQVKISQQKKGTGWGEAINGGFGLVLDGTPSAARRAKMMLHWDVFNGVTRRGWAGNQNANSTLDYEEAKNPLFKATRYHDTDLAMLDLTIAAHRREPSSSSAGSYVKVPSANSIK